MSPAGFELAAPASERRQTHALSAQPPGSAKLILDLFDIRPDLLGTVRGGRVALI
jgi:hypothetical protein